MLLSLSLYSTVIMILLSSASRIDLSSWKVLIGGSTLPKKMCQAARARGIDIYAGYGMSETCPILTVAHVGNRELEEDAEIDIRCKTGRPLPLVQLRVVDEHMQDVPRDGSSVGEIVVRAPWLTQGYLKDSRNSENLWRQGYLHTGDVANIDADNYVSITDRMKDVIKTGGEWLSSLELEDIIHLHPAVSEVAVIGVTDEKWGERPMALIVVKKDVVRPNAKEITSHIRSFIDKGLLSKLALLTNVRYVGTIDKTSVGKINKKLLREKYPH